MLRASPPSSPSVVNGSGTHARLSRVVLAVLLSGSSHGVLSAQHLPGAALELERGMWKTTSIRVGGPRDAVASSLTLECAMSGSEDDLQVDFRGQPGTLWGASIGGSEASAAAPAQQASVMIELPRQWPRNSETWLHISRSSSPPLRYFPDPSAWSGPERMRTLQPAVPNCQGNYHGLGAWRAQDGDGGDANLTIHYKSVPGQPPEARFCFTWISSQGIHFTSRPAADVALPSGGWTPDFPPGYPATAFNPIATLPPMGSFPGSIASDWVDTPFTLQRPDSDQILIMNSVFPGTVPELPWVAPGSAEGALQRSISNSQGFPTQTSLWTRYLGEPTIGSARSVSGVEGGWNSGYKESFGAQGHHFDGGINEAGGAFYDPDLDGPNKYVFFYGTKGSVSVNSAITISSFVLTWTTNPCNAEIRAVLANPTSQNLSKGDRINVSGVLDGAQNLIPEYNGSHIISDLTATGVGPNRLVHDVTYLVSCPPTIAIGSAAASATIARADIRYAVGRATCADPFSSAAPVFTRTPSTNFVYAPIGKAGFGTWPGVLHPYVFPHSSGTYHMLALGRSSSSDATTGIGHWYSEDKGLTWIFDKVLVDVDLLHPVAPAPKNRNPNTPNKLGELLYFNNVLGSPSGLFHTVNGIEYVYVCFDAAGPLWPEWSIASITRQSGSVYKVTLNPYAPCREFVNGDSVVIEGTIGNQFDGNYTVGGFNAAAASFLISVAGLPPDQLAGGTASYGRQWGRGNPGVGFYVMRASTGF